LTTIEASASAFWLLCVWLTVRQNIWCWPTGLVMVSLYVWIFYQVRLYSDMILQVIYIVLQIYGWAHWLRGGPRESPLPITRHSKSQTTETPRSCFENWDGFATSFANGSGNGRRDNAKMTDDHFR
jgi:nicotinamide riboside transporter PnuC